MEVGGGVLDSPESWSLEQVAGDAEGEGPTRSKQLRRKLVRGKLVGEAQPRIGRHESLAAVDDELMGGEIELVAFRNADAEKPQTGNRQEDVEFVGHVEDRSAVAHCAQPARGARSDRHIVEHRAPALLRCGTATRKPRRRSSLCEEEERQRREKAR